MQLFTWNLQRSQTVNPAFRDDDDADHIVDLRRELLEELCAASRYGMIVEPPPYMRDMIKNTPHEPIPGGFIVMDMRSDNQTDWAACRPALWMTQKTGRLVGLRITSGASDAYRYPVVWHVPLTARHSILVASIHATSGRLGRRNSEGLITSIKNYAKRNSIGGVMVGGDFNSHSTHTQLPDIPKRRNGWTWSMPAVPTNQSAAGGSGGGIDGFFFFTNAKCPGPVVFDVDAPETYYQRDPGRFSLTLTPAALKKAVKGKAARQAYQFSDTPGFARFADAHAFGDGHAWWWRLSDHAPVIQEVGMRLMDPANRVVDYVQ